MIHYRSVQSNEPFILEIVNICFNTPVIPVIMIYFFRRSRMCCFLHEALRKQNVLYKTRHIFPAANTIHMEQYGLVSLLLYPWNSQSEDADQKSVL